MAEEALVEVSNLSKKFCKDLKKSLWYGVKDVVGGTFGKAPSLELRKDEFWALKDINFTLKRGECLGLIGHNGAGKSTLLKILNGLLIPDAGSVTMRGKVGALIELGAGFNPILSGRENIYNNGAVLGFSKQEIDAKLEEIIDFAEVREFIEMPVKNYSSGMRVRLGFAVAAQLEPDVLIIDEVLAVGDANFRAKCYERISKLMRDCAIILVSHSMTHIARTATKCIVLGSGVEIFNGHTGEAMEVYYAQNSKNTQEVHSEIFSNYCHLKKFSIENKQINNLNDRFEIDLELFCDKDLNDVELDLFIMSKEHVPICQISSKILNRKIALKKGTNNIRCVLFNLNLNVGTYSFAITILDSVYKNQYLWVQNLEKLIVNGDNLIVSPVILNGALQIEVN